MLRCAILALLLSCAAAPKSTLLALPNAPAGGVFLDYSVYEPAHDRVWVPAGGTGGVAVIDAKTRAITMIGGFPTKTVERNGKTRLVGPSSATVGDGVVYIGNRGDSSICAFDAATLAKRTCAILSGSPDGIQYVASTHEVWVTTPRDQALLVLDAQTLAEKAKIATPGEPEGFAVDEAHHRFFTNLEDKDKTLAIDLASHAIVETWDPKCGEDGPKGLVFDGARLVVVCPDHLETLDPAHDGALGPALPIGPGLDAIDYRPERHELVAAAGGAATLVFVTLGPDGSLTARRTVSTAKGARNAVLAADGTAFVADGPAGAVLVR
ncbi:MAG TPA: PQQ-binding-like beta-propeller repeat protein [Kofleriaceae bacterium]|jgi:DNA-binding beta-propeller fold protein YncE